MSIGMAASTAARVGPVSLGNTETANETPSAVVGMEPGSGHIPLQGAGKVCIDVGLHRCDCGPAPGPELGQSKDMLEPGKTPVELAAVARETFPAQQVC